MECKERTRLFSYRLRAPFWWQRCPDEEDTLWVWRIKRVPLRCPLWRACRILQLCPLYLSKPEDISTVSMSKSQECMYYDYHYRHRYTLSLRVNFTLSHHNIKFFNGSTTSSLSPSLWKDKHTAQIYRSIHTFVKTVCFKLYVSLIQRLNVLLCELGTIIVFINKFVLPLAF